MFYSPSPVYVAATIWEGRDRRAHRFVVCKSFVRVNKVLNFQPDGLLLSFAGVLGSMELLLLGKNGLEVDLDIMILDSVI